MAQQSEQTSSVSNRPHVENVTSDATDADGDPWLRYEEGPSLRTASISPGAGSAKEHGSSVNYKIWFAERHHEYRVDDRVELTDAENGCKIRFKVRETTATTVTLIATGNIPKLIQQHLDAQERKLVHKVAQGLEGLRSTLASLRDTRVCILFAGDHVNGKSWCPECTVSEPVIESVLSTDRVKQLNMVFITCYVGSLPYWKDPKCPFRTESDLKLTCVPTLIEYGSKRQKRLQGNQLSNSHLIESLLTDE